jgi:2-C-methyl-D-erythritol 2,4-cyclodiphosphate synthase
MRVGTGWDLHKLASGRALVLGGVAIPSEKGCVGHSDGDALLHAVIDALLGACGLEDIGTLFPDTDPTYKNADSAALLAQVVSKIKALGFSICNVDTTVILQAPKLGPYKAQMKERLAALLGIETNAVGVKAKTAEGLLGELGQGDAVIAQAVVLVK